MTPRAGSVLAAALLTVLAGLVVLGGLFSAQEEADQACSTMPTVMPAAGPAGGVRVAQANIKTGMPGRKFRADLARVRATGADFVSLNEQARRGDAEITPAGYGMWRMPQPRRGDDGTALLWRTDRWAKVDAGRVILVANGPQRWDYDRPATWVTLRDDDGAMVSMVSVHHMINPRKFGPNKPRRQELYRRGMEKVQSLVRHLSGRGPVFVAGDFNSQYRHNDPWGPRIMLGAIGMRSTFDQLGLLGTHDGGPRNAIDYIFFQQAAAAPTGHDSIRLNSDHHLLVADFTLAGSEDREGAGPGGAQRPAAPVANVPAVPGWSAEQVRNAAAIIAAGQEIGISARGQTIGVMTAIGESSLRVLDHGDGAGPDSRGLFQQRDNGAWGTYADRMDPRRSSLMFFAALMKVPGWETLPPTIAAHRTQRNADPYHYEQYWDDAVRLYASLGDSADALALTSGAVTGCDSVALVSNPGGTVVYPIPESMKDSDRHNWGNAGSSWASQHTGTDFSVPCGTPVFASHAGTVVIDRTQGWAGPQLVKVSTGEGRLTTWYAHMQTATVRPGQPVAAGQQIGEVGSEGNSTGCHLHFEVHPQGGSIYEDNINPSDWLAQWVGKNLDQPSDDDSR